MAYPPSCVSPLGSSSLFFGIQRSSVTSVRAVPGSRWIRSIVIALGLLLLNPACSYGQEIANRWEVGPDRPTAEMRFGWSVALEDGIVVVGAPGDATNGPKAGAAYVFEWVDGDWVRTKLLPPNGEANARFGWKVGVDNGRIAVTAPWASNPVPGRSGKIHLYRRSGSSWQPHLLRVGDPAVEGQIGRGLAMAGGRLIAGAPYDSTANGKASGSIIVFEESADGWTSQTLTPARGTSDAWFGLTVAATDTHVGAGAYHTDQPTGPEAGAAFLFNLSADGTWRETALAPMVEPARKDHFGRSLAFLGKKIFVGAEEDDNETGTNAGGVFGLRLDAPDRLAMLITPSDGASRTYFGFALAATDRYLAASHGAEVHLFSGFDASIVQDRRLKALSGRSLPASVTALAGSGRHLVVGSAYADDPGPDAGYVEVVEFAP